MRRVVVTGLECAAHLVMAMNTVGKSLISSKSGIRKLSGFETADLKSQVGGQLVLEGKEDLFPDKVIEQKDKKKIEPFIEYALIAAKEAIDDSSWKVENDEQSMNTGVMVGSGIGGLDGIRKSAENLNNSPRKNFTFFYSILFNQLS